ncbi:hypothetical protein ColLi_08165 [Colletotrichum liriopes]|uniref:Uncharacterized protein n=1 Tax=Colletotrichum liriopes TaxID=708192 RepID=A0AA37GQX8_9PEZI|nr:hypothetical protein ColLi_08165 [Colletotrichum liriopes]
MTDLYGFTETAHPANFYYRMNSFGLNCESVDICGRMAELIYGPMPACEPTPKESNKSQTSQAR